MAGNQREMQRKERKSRKDRKNKLIVWIIIALLVVILAVMKICEININSVKDHFTNANGEFTLTEGVVEDNFPYNLDSSRGVVIRNVNNKIGVLTPSSFSVLNSKNADTDYSFAHGYSNPMLDSSGIYTLIYDQGAKQMRLDNTSSNVYQHTADNDILCAAVAKNGSVVCATTSQEKKCDVFVINRKLTHTLDIGVSYGYVVDVTVNDSASRIAFVAVNSENAQLKSKLYTYNVSGAQQKAEIDLPYGNVIDIRYSADNIYIVADTYIGVVTGGKKLVTVFEAGKINTVSFTYTPSNQLVLAYNGFDNSTDNTVLRIKPNGKYRKTASVKGNIKALSATSSVVTVLTNNEIISFNLSNMKEKERIETDDSVKSICRMGSEVLVHRQSILDRCAVNEKQEVK